ncbi:MAG: HipA domain-containing protein [Myxococcaceae bacterium]|nr:HipA domain-containing protein [Myxococcaceae bacterium]
MVFNVLVSNRDDHLRNHGFLRTASGWRLAPAFDLNPNLDKHDHALLLDEASAEPRIDTVLATAEYYRLSAKRAGEVVSNVNAIVKTWKTIAASVGLARAEIQRMAAAFEHQV